MKEKVCIVTGANRGIGKGIALGLAEKGYTICAVGLGEGMETLPAFLAHTSLEQTVQEIQNLGGKGISYECDLSNDLEIEALVKMIYEAHGRIDLLVNSAWSGSAHVIQPYYFNTPFWEQPVSLWDDHYKVGLRSNYVLSREVSKHMLEASKGMMINISFYGGRKYANNVSYGVMKAALDRLSKDMAHELDAYGIKVYSLYPNSVKTEGMIELAKYSPDLYLDKMESPQYVGRCVAALLEDVENKCALANGDIVITTDIAEALSVTDLDGTVPPSLKSLMW